MTVLLSHRAIGVMLVGAVAILASCSSKPSAPASPSGTGDASADGGQDALTDEGVDIGAADAEPACPGAFGCPCEADTECGSAHCVETSEGGRCSEYCGDGKCAPGWSCKGQSGSRDASDFCIPDGGLLCRPCDDDDTCRASGHKDAACIDYGDGGSFCGIACASDAGCPAGSACKDAKGVDGGAVKQCVRAGAGPGGLGTCDCPPISKLEAHGTDCWLVDGEGAKQRRCKGRRVCGDAGLGACTALTGAEALCLEVQCLDPLTKLPLPDNTACDDGRACTAGDLCQKGDCQSGTQICACEPGIVACPTPSATEAANKCRGALYCAQNTASGGAAFVCVPNPAQTKVCDASLDGTCSKNACEPVTGVCGMTAVERTLELCDLPAGADGKPGCRREVKPPDSPDGPLAACDDGLACSLGEVCKASACSSADAAACKCKADVECKDDNDLCNGTPYCDKSGPTWECKINPATVVVCDPSSDTACMPTACVAKTGACVKAPAAPGTLCNDGVTCTVGDVCDSGGKCVPGTWTCCKVDADCAKDEDGNACNGKLFCDKAAGACKINPASVVTCPSVGDTACAKAACDPKTGGCEAAAVNVGKPCDDGDVCTEGEVCTLGTCNGGADTCSCGSDPDCAGKDDGDLCNGVLYCNKAIGKCKLNPATAVTCPSVDDSACKHNLCQKKTGTCAMVDLPAQVTCDADGTGCTANDACDGKGACAAGTAVCVCTSDADCAGFEDGDVCNGTLFCDKSGPAPACKVNPKSLKSCPSVDDTACAENLCQKKTGQCAMSPRAAGTVCSDGQVCTGGDACDGAGACAAGKVALCGCKIDGDCAAFDDGDVCNGAFACAAGSCVPTAKVTDCADKEPCTDDACAPKTGCVHLPNNATCTDGEACLVGETCIGGACSKPLKGLDCEDGNGCTDDSCDKLKGCQHIANTKACSDGDVCTTGEVCKDSACDAKSSKPTECSDQNACTVDSCGAVKGCSYALVADGASCPDQPSGACLAGTCKPTSCGLGLGAVAIDDGGQKVFACEAIGPVWGKRPTSPAGVYTFGQAVGGQKVVKDAQTGLEWDPSASTEKAWKDAVAHCDGRVYAGKSDWRLPSVVELASLVDYGTWPPGGETAVDQAHFSLTKAMYHWTSTAIPGVAGKGWAIDFGHGNFAPASGGEVLQVRCVRGAAAPATISRFAVHVSGKSVLDRWTNLRWQRAPTQGKWSQGVSECASLKLDEGGTYRLPTVRELHGLLDVILPSPRIDGAAFPGTPIDLWYWGGTTLIYNNGFAWRVEFGDGSVYNGVPKEAIPQWVRCVADAPSCAKDADCDDGDPCTTGKCLPSGACGHLPASGAACAVPSGCPGLCDAGACKPTGDPLPAASTLTLVASTTARSLSPDANGGAAICLSGYEDKTGIASNWVRRVNAKAEALWQVELGNKQLGNTCSVVAVQANDSVTALGVIGKISDNNRDIAYWRWDANGKPLVQSKALSLGISVGFTVLGQDALGGVMGLGGSRTKDKGSTGWAALVDANGNLAMQDTVPGSASEAEIRTLVGTAAGWRYFGRAQTAGGYDGVVTAIHGADGKKLSGSWVSDGLYAYASAGADDGGWWLVVGPPGSQILRRHGADGRLLFAKPLPQKIVIYKAKHTAIGLLLAGTDTLTANSAFVARVDASGAIVWQRLLPFAPKGSLVDVAWTGKEVWAVGTVHLSGTEAQAYLLRLDAWGRSLCSSGGCADQGASACDDGDPCTTDRCNTADGKCSATPMADATPCGSFKVCGAGKCVSACGNGQLDALEACDDGGNNAGDGCDAVCAWEPYAERLYIPRRTFFMGCNATVDKACQEDEKPQRAVTLSAYWIDRFELTAERYKACATASACAKKSQGTVASSEPTLPATHLNFADAENACGFVTPGGRLPTEAEWERAARGDCTLSPGTACATAMPTYPWYPANPGTGCTYATTSECSGPKPVGTPTAGASPYGALDMAGNVDEWVSDWYSAASYATGPTTDPKGPDKADKGNHVARGGSYTSNASIWHLRAAGRISHHKDLNSPFVASLGVRCARDAGVCGDGKRDLGEDCDDGNVADKDGCPGDCRLH